MVWMMAFWTIRSSLSLLRPEEMLTAEFLLEVSPSSKSTLILRCLSSVLKTSSTVGPEHTHTHTQSHLSDASFLMLTVVLVVQQSGHLHQLILWRLAPPGGLLRGLLLKPSTCCL